MKRLFIISIAIVLLKTSMAVPLGMEDGRITDVQITASGCYDLNHCTDRARLNQPQSGGKTGAWSARVNNGNQFIQADLRYLYDVTGVMTQGRNAYSQWVTSYEVHYSLDGLTWTPVINALEDGSQIFNGNSDRDTAVTIDFAGHVTARFIRFVPVTWYGHISMRFEILGTLSSKTEGPEHALGMKDGQIPDNALSASSVYNANHGVDRARPDTVAGGGKTGAWSARVNNANQWIQTDLNGFYLVTGVVTQGRQDYDQWVTAFKVAFSQDGTSWTFSQDCNGNDKTFSGNSDRSTKVTTLFDRPIHCRFMRIHPTAWNGHISMRFEILGRGAVAGRRFEPLKLGMEDRRIAASQLSSSTCYNANHCVDRARLNQVAGGGNTGAWSAQINDHSQWIQADLQTDYMFQGIITQGRSDYDQWVTSFSLQYKADGQSSFTDIVDANGAVRIFSGNSDRTSLVVNEIALPVTARVMRIHPETWHGHISMRFELLGDGPINVVPNPDKLGIEDGLIPSTSMSASTCWDGEHCVVRSRLNQLEVPGGRGAWSARVNNDNQWIQVDLRAAFEVTGVFTQGRHELTSNHNQWVTSYRISYSIDGKDWIFVRDCGSVQLFPGNSDRSGIVQNPINPPVTARFFRLHPVTWHNHISLRWELVGEGPITLADASAKLGIEDYRITDGALTSSTEYDSNHGARRARLNIAASGSLKGAWSAQTLDQSQWLQVDLRGTYRVTGIITQGRQDTDQWVTSFKVSHSLDGQDFTTVLSEGTQQERVFPGNSNRNTQVTNTFAPALTTRFIRVLPYMWHGHISTRIELLGAGPVANILQDSVPLGLESYVISDSSLTASTEYNADHGVKRARLNLARVGNLRGAWSAGANNANQWIQVNLLAPYRITAVATQGRQDVDQWVTAYKIACSLDGATFDTVQGICTNPGADRVFSANGDRNTLVTNNLPVPKICRYVRLMPTAWHGHISLRSELYGEGPVTV